MYLVDIPKRESEAIRRLLKLIPISGWLFESLGFDPLFSWYLIEVRTDLHLGLLSTDIDLRAMQPRLILRRRRRNTSTDIDILAGRLSWSDSGDFRSILAEEIKSEPNAPQSVHLTLAALKLAESGGIKWPPLMNYLIGIEVKCAYLDPDADEITGNAIKSKKSSKEAVYEIQEQVKKLLSFGFDKDALLDVIANPPASGINGQAFVTAANIATTSKEAMSRILKQRLPENSSAGHWVWPIGSVIGGDESQRGASIPVELQTACENKSFQVDMEVKENRQKMEFALNKIFEKLSPPYNSPVIFVDWRICCKIHRLEDACNN